MELIKVLVGIAYFFTLYLLVYWILYFFEKKQFIHNEMKTVVKISKYPKISILVPCYNEEKTVHKTLKSIVKLDYPKNKIEVIVINDGSTDKTKNIVTKFIENSNYNMTYLYQKNQGKAVALNKGLQKLNGMYFACLDADSFVHKDALKHMVYDHQLNKNLAIVTPVMKIHNPKNTIQKFQHLEYMGSMLIIKLMGYMDSNYIAPGPFSLYKTETIKSLGGFDEENLVEDQEIAYRAQKAHYQIKQCSNAYVTTIAPDSFKKLNKQRNRWFKGSILNIIKYRNIVFNKDYGDFGFFQMPVNIISFMLGLLAVISFLYYTLKPILEWIRDLYLINFDIFPFLTHLKFNLNILGFDLQLLSMMFISLFMTVLVLYFSSRATRDRVRKYGVLYIFPYFFIYFVLMGYVITKVFIELLLGVKQKW